MKYLTLIRYKNLLLIALMQFVFRFTFFKEQNIYLSLANWQFLLLIIATISIAAGGYIINNISDVNTDAINKYKNVVVGKGISEKLAYNLYIAFTILGVTIGFYLSNVIQKPSFATIFVVVAATLYLYATSLKQTVLIGNIIIALLLSFSIIILGIFDLYPATYDGNQKIMGLIFRILIDYGIFAFLLNLIREIVKDLEDVDGDYNQGMNTLPIFLGKKRTTKLVFALSVIPILLVIYYIKIYLFDSNLIISALYGLIFILTPLIYFSIKIWNAKKQNEYHHLSNILKWILFFGILSITVISYNVK